MNSMCKLYENETKLLTNLFSVDFAVESQLLEFLQCPTSFPVLRAFHCELKLDLHSSTVDEWIQSRRSTHQAQHMQHHCCSEWTIYNWQQSNSSAKVQVWRP